MDLASTSETPTTTGSDPAASASTVMGLPEWTVLAVISQQPTHGFAVATLTAFAGQTAQLRFRLASDFSVNREGWYVDDVTVHDVASFGWPSIWT